MIFNKCKLSDQFKIGAIATTQKKEKPMKNPDSDRQITVASNLGKLLEEMMARSEPATKAKQDPLQFGFTAGCTPGCVHFLLPR